MEAISRNVRHAVRVLARTPGFTLTVVATLALGIGANSAVFSAIDAVLLQPLPYTDPDRLVTVMQTYEQAGQTTIAPVRLEDWNERSSTFEAITGYFTEDVSETTGDTPGRVRWAGVAPRFLDVWRVAPLLGRNFVPGDRLQRPTVVWISERLWRDRFDSDPAILERTIRLGNPAGFPFQIVGVLPESFRFPDRAVDVWFPNFTDYEQAQSRNSTFYIGVGRLGPGVTLEQARADLERVQAQLTAEYPDTDRDVGVSIAPLKETVVGPARASLWLVFGAVSLLLLIACTNIAALLLSRAAQREHEISVRYSLGASRSAVAMLMLTEAAVLAVAGAAAGLVLAGGASAVLRALAPELPRLDEIAVDGRIVAYTAASTVIIALLCGLFPAVRNARGAGPLARAGGRTQVGGRHAMQWSLVGVQVALSVMLLVGAGLLLRSFDAVSRVDPGFEASGVLAFRVSGSNFEYVNSDVPARIASTVGELRSLPGIEAATTTSALPGVVDPDRSEIELVEMRDAGQGPLVVDYRAVSPGYFEMMQIPLVAGELCREGPDRATETMVNRTFADRYGQGRPVIGLHIARDTPARIVGIVADAREVGMDRDPVPTAYDCATAPSAVPWFLLRTSGDPAAAMGIVRTKLAEIEPQRSVYDLAPLEAHIGDAYAQDRLRTLLLTLFAGTALALSCLGIYGTLSYAVSLRRREVGLRVALGAAWRRIVAQFLARALRVVGIACAAGLALSFLFTRVLGGMLYGVSPSDPATLAAVVALVLAVALVAALWPALRASRIDPMQALREE